MTKKLLGILLCISCHTLLLDAAQSTFPVTTDSNGVLNSNSNVIPANISGMFWDSPSNKWTASPIYRHRQPLLVTTAAIMKTNGIVVGIFHGDSLNSSDYQAEELQELFAQRYGWCGADGSAGASTDYGRFAYRYGISIGGAAYITNDLTRWYSYHYILPTIGSQIQVGSSQPGISSSGNLIYSGNVIRIVYGYSNTFGAFAVWTNFGVGAAVMTNIVCNNPTPGVLETNRYFYYTNSSVTPMQITLSSLSNNNCRIISCGIFDNTKPGFIYNQQANPGMYLAQFNSTPTNSWGPVYREYNPSFICLKTINNGAASISNEIRTWTYNMRYWCPNADLVFFGVHPQSTSDDNTKAINLALQLFAATNGIYYFPTYDYMGGSYSNFLNMGFVSDGTHLNQSAANFIANAEWNWMNLLGELGQYQPIYYVNNPLEIRTMGGFNFYGGLYASRSNALETYKLGKLSGGIQDDGIPFYQLTNTPFAWPSIFRMFTQTNDSSITNITTTTNSFVGATSGLGSIVMSNNFWSPGRSIKIKIRGYHNTPATPGNTLLMVNAKSTTFTNTLATNIIALAANLVTEPFEFDLKLTCRTNSASVGYIQVNGKFYTTSSGSTTLLYKELKGTRLLMDTTAASVIDVACTNGASTISLTSQEVDYQFIP